MPGDDAGHVGAVAELVQVRNRSRLGVERQVRPLHDLARRVQTGPGATPLSISATPMPEPVTPRPQADDAPILAATVYSEFGSPLGAQLPPQLANPTLASLLIEMIRESDSPTTRPAGTLATTVSSAFSVRTMEMPRARSPAVTAASDPGRTPMTYVPAANCVVLETEDAADGEAAGVAGLRLPVSGRSRW